MNSTRNAALLALDGGTTNTRARLLIDGVVVASARRGVGVRDNLGSAGVSPLAEAVRECIIEVIGNRDLRLVRIVAAGMLSSEVGLTSVRHVVAPAGIAELAAAAVEYRLPDFEAPPILIVPGVRTPAGLGTAGWLDADVMRGEEVETLGAAAALGLAGRPVAFLWPGSHTKLVEVDSEGRILRSFTTLAGEITATLASHTIISKSLPSTLPEEPDLGAVELGMRTAVEAGIGRAAFAVRLAELSGSLDAHGRASFWVGAVIGEDCARIAAHPIAKSGVPIWVGGRDPQRRLYADRLAALVESPIALIEESLATTASAVGAGIVADVYDSSIKNR